jgi:hypothetical protein
LKAFEKAQGFSCAALRPRIIPHPAANQGWHLMRLGL